MKSRDMAVNAVSGEHTMEHARYAPSVKASTPQKLRIQPAGTWQGANLAELWRYRELLYFFVWRDLKVRYKQTVLGAMWAIIQPVATTLLFTVFFGHLGGLSKQVTGSYSLFVYIGLSLWTFYANAVSLSANSLVGSSHLISKVYFPRILIPIAAILSGLVDFAIAFGFLLVLMVFYHVPPSPQIVAVPLFVGGTLAVAAGAGILFAALVVSYRDFRYVITFVVQLWLFATPVLYALDIIPPRWRLLYGLNPMVGMISGFRTAILGGSWASDVIGAGFLTAVVLLLVALRYFATVERRFADVI